MTQKKVLTFVASGPSAVGKGTLIKGVLKTVPNLPLLTSYTTRARRTKETDGVEYHFISKDEFFAMVSRGEFAEHAEVHGNYYGTSLPLLLEKRNKGEFTLLEIDYQGAKLIKDQFPDALRVFILPPSPHDLVNRIRERGQDSDEAIASRLQSAAEEIRNAEDFDYWIVNRDLGTATQDLCRLISCIRSGLRPNPVKFRNQGHLKDVKRTFGIV